MQTIINAIVASSSPAPVMGCEIVSASTPTINGTYAVDPASIADVMAEVQFIAAFAEFSTMAQTMTWSVIGGAVTFPTPAAAMSVFKALAQYVTALKQYAAGMTITPPIQPVSIP